MADELISIDLLQPLLARRPVGLVSDIDGTLSPIVPDPEAARVAPRALDLLRRLIERGVRVALASGRSLEKAREMAPIEGAAFAANHGLDLWIEGRLETPDAARSYEGKARAVLARMTGLREAGVVVEDKGAVLAFHYRNAPDGARTRDAILSAIASSTEAREFRVSEGRKLVELRPPLDINKGTALRELVGRLKMAAVLCLGDDTTDIDMFRAVSELREGSEVLGANVAVFSEEAAPGLLEAADYWVRGVEGVERLLAELLTALP